MRKLFSNYRIDYVLFICFAGFIIALVGLVAGISYRVSARDQAQKTSFYQQGMLYELNRQLAASLNSVEQTSLAISQNSTFVDFVAEKGDYYLRNKARTDLERDYLSPIVYSSPLIFSIQVFMDEPTLIDRRAYVQFLPRSEANSEMWYPFAEKTDFVWVGNHPAVSAQGTMPVISFVRQIMSKSQQSIGYLVINVKVKALQDIIGADNPSSRRLLLDSGGRTMLGSGLAPKPQDIAALLREIKGDAGYLHLRVDPSSRLTDQDVLMVWSRSFPEGWTLVELTPWSDITASSRELARTLGGVGALAVVVALFFALYLSRHFTTPIRELMKLMSAYSLDRSVRAFPDHYRNEFGSLFNGYRKLIERIEELYRSLEVQYRAQKEAEIKALQAMINPHFLYNTLDQLNWMAIEAGQSQISHVLELMGRMFRIGLSGGESVIPLGDELTHTECYLHIQQLKWEDGLTFEIEADERLRRYLIPKLTLQPFVENAIIHGFHGRSRGHVKIAVREEADGLAIRITDDGVGIPSDWMRRKSRKTGGYGIRNVLERIDAYFGPPYGVSIRALQAGTEVLIRIPFLTNSDSLKHGGAANVENRHCG